jgi:hypothetical protein
MCDRADVPQSAKLKAFPTMLKGLALDYYYSNMSTNSMTPITFDEVCFSMRNYFEGAEYRRGILSKWNNLTLKSIMTKSGNEDKSTEECLQLLIKNLRHLQHGLDPKLRSEKFIHNKLINACQDVSACQYACFKPSDSLADLINDLRSSIVTYQKANSANSTETFETFFTDRRYHKNFSPRTGNSTPSTPRTNQDRRYPPKKKCFVCHKEGCWSTKHSKDERETARQKFKNRLNRFSIRIDHYISEYEGTDPSSSSYSEHDSDTDLNEMEALIVDLPALPPIPDNPSNVETFMTSFDPVENANAEIMTTNLANRLLSHFLTDNLHTSMNDQTSDVLQTDLKTPMLSDHIQIDLNAPTPVHTCMKDTTMEDIDPFTYITTDRYTSEVFYGIMIDSGASVRSIAGYGQYLAFIKNTSIDLDHTKAGAVNVQFEIESIFSLGSITIDIPIGLVEFHVIKTDTPFLLSLADMNRLKVYFNNVENTLFMITKNRDLPIIRRFGHGFLL